MVVKRSAGFLMGVLAGGLLLAGCAAPLPVVTPAAVPTARFVMVNLSDSAWEIGLTPMAGDARRWRVGPRALIEESIPAGEYRGEQILLSAAGSAEASRSLVVRLEAGKDYRWRLTTLLAAPIAGGDTAGTAAGAGAR